MTFSKVFFWGCVCFVFGIAVSPFFPAFQFIFLFLISVCALIIFRKQNGKKDNKRAKNLIALGFCFFAFLSGIWRYQCVYSRAGAKGAADQKIDFLGVISEDPILDNNRIKFEALSEDNAFEGKVLITTSRYPEYKYGDKIKVRGTLKTPVVFEDFNYRDYLRKQGVFWVMYYPEIKYVESGLGNPTKSVSVSLKNKLNQGLNKTMPLPQSGLMEALLFGDESNISDEWKEKLNTSGTRHIAAVSGMNITIITAMLLNLFLALGFWRSHAFWGAIILIIFYIFMIGAPSSGVRAAIMAILFLVCQRIGRLSDNSRIMLFALCFMLIFNPLLLRFDIGFQLSFLAVAGLLYLQPRFMKIFKRIPDFFQLRYNISATLAAQVFTFPILVYYFGRISLTSILPNILILPFLTLTTILGFIASFLAIFLYPLGQIVSWFGWLFVTYFLGVINFFAKIPFSSLSFKGFGFLFVFLFYLLLSFFIFKGEEKEKLEFLNY